jgi:hypothetical protein
VQAHNQTSGHQEAIKTSADLAIWTLAWVATLALARFGPIHLWDSQPVASWAAVAANLAVGVGWIIAHARYLRGIDELQRKIMQDALAVTLGAGWVIGFAYVVADDAGLIAYDANVAVFSVLLAVVYMVAIAVGHLRYR